MEVGLGSRDTNKVFITQFIKVSINYNSQI